LTRGSSFSPSFWADGGLAYPNTLQHIGGAAQDLRRVNEGPGAYIHGTPNGATAC
jgi:hypothetical protein